MKKLGIIIAIFFMIAVAAQSAFAYAVDGNLNDWGVTPAAFGSSDWTPNPGVYFTEEDYEPGTADGFIDPGTGGQTFDAEAMYIDYDNDNLYYAIVTGLPATGSDDIRPGDVAFDFGIDGIYEYGIKTIDYWGDAGSLYAVTKWEPGTDWPGKGTVAAPTEMIDYVELFNPAVSAFAYNKDFYGAFDHWVIEGFIPHAYFGADWGKPFRAHWTQTCGNDAIDVNVPIPEPATVSLLGIGILGLLKLRKRIS